MSLQLDSPSKSPVKISQKLVQKNSFCLNQMHSENQVGQMEYDTAQNLERYSRHTSVSPVQEQPLWEPEPPVEQQQFELMPSPIRENTNNLEIQQQSARPKRKISRTNYNTDDSPIEDDQHKACQCTKSHCLQLYCSCFHNKKLCSKECACKDCFNNGSNEEQRIKAVEQIKVKEQRASNHDLDLFDTTMVWGCKCKKTKCQKGYCECYIRNKKCTSHCQCRDCANKRATIHKKINKHK